MCFKTTGSIDSVAEWKRQVLELTTVLSELGVTNVLMDESELSTPHSMLAYIDLVGFVLREKSISIRGLRLAIISKQENLKASKFGELFASNRGITVKVFLDRTEAEQWLVK
ncbi:MAG: hypothetical protein ACI85F_002570 [Bacteroidia bacterium]